MKQAENTYWYVWAHVELRINKRQQYIKTNVKASSERQAIFAALEVHGIGLQTHNVLECDAVQVNSLWPDGSVFEAAVQASRERKLRGSSKPAHDPSGLED